MALVAYQPWRGVSQLQSEINRLFSDWRNEDSSGATANWVPSVDIHELDDRFELFVDLPGVDPKDVEITLHDSVLTISGERPSPFGDGEKRRVGQWRSERGHGRFYRRFILPETVDAENVKANGRNGVLEVAIPKQAKALPRRIKVAA
jgi:HSP20 family protein